MTARRAMVAVLALLLVLGGTTTGAAGPAERNQEPDWLARVNELRVGSGLHPLVEDPGRSAALQEAVNYMAGTGQVGHELPDDAGPAAQRAARSSNLTHELAGTTPTAMVDGWMTDPGHLVNVLNPDVALTGFAQATFTEQTSNAGDVVAGLWTIQQDGEDQPPAPRYPYVFPGEGSTVELPPSDGPSYDESWAHCDGYVAPVGFPVLAMLDNPFEPTSTIGATALVNTDTGAGVEHCRAVGDDAILRNTVSILPRHPLPAGRYRATVEVDGAPLTWTFGIGSEPTQPTEPPAAVAMEVVAEDPTSLSVRISTERFLPAAAAHAVLASAERFPDALAGTALTGTGPMLLTPSGSLDDAVAAELQRVVPAGGTVFLLGGEAALSGAVESAVTALGFTPRRLAGPTRVHTAVEVARVVTGSVGSTEAVVARAGSGGADQTAAWADSVAVGAWTADTASPVLLTDSTSLSPEVDAALQELRIAMTVVVGGTAAVSDAVMASLPAPDRVAGSSRTGTAVAIAQQLVAGTGVVLIDGFAEDGWASGLAGAGLAADRGWAVLMAGQDTLPADTAAALPGCASQVAVVGDAAFAEGLRSSLAERLDPGC